MRAGEHVAHVTMRVYLYYLLVISASACTGSRRLQTLLGVTRQLRMAYGFKLAACGALGIWRQSQLESYQDMSHGSG
jgi:hypothetical protein